MVKMNNNPKNISKKVTIEDVCALDGDYFSVYLSNKNVILIWLGERMREPAFTALVKIKAFDKPQTDGERLYWTADGPNLCVDEIMEMAVK